MAAKRIESADKWPDRVHLTSLRAKTNACADLLLPQRRAFAIDRPWRTEFSCVLASCAGQARDFIRIELNMLVLTTTATASANVSERRAARRNGGLIRHVKSYNQS